MNNCFTCLNCGRINPRKGDIFTYKYCNNKCQAEHRSRALVNEWKDNQSTTAWRQVPEYVKKYLISTRGHKCETCGIEEWKKQPAPLVVTHQDNNTHNNEETNLLLVCPNCRAQK